MTPSGASENGVGLGEIGGGQECVTSTNPATSPPIEHAPDMEGEPMTATQERTSIRKHKPLDIVREGDGDTRHGKLSTYNNHHCRCSACTEAMRTYGRHLRERRRQALAGD